MNPNNRKKLKNYIVSTFSAASVFVAVTAFAEQGGYAQPVEFYQSYIRSNVSYEINRNTYTSKYNCLAYVLGVRDYTIWPWGQNNPTSGEMTNVLKQFGYSPINNGSPNNPPKLVTYGTLNNVGHIGKVVEGTNNVTDSKWGAYELVKTYSLSPYTSSPGYGPAVQYYY
ncbi:hypothetical protein P4H65_09710 [Paenibacillus chitinolyticus]|uniref:DUF7689 domain-containing protein n=1 Tax=Paenibacillus chitinolyticus TaxID=79263 RepID=UPI002DB84AD2|nr:hypothetical protein [Paenibacillus chitinolyticus]MEC0246059.1 hypothetical protein [Paenibacillus chitinolyticus]